MNTYIEGISNAGVPGFSSVISTMPALSQRDRVVYNVMLEEGAKFILSARDGGAVAALYPGKPLWLYVKSDYENSYKNNYKNNYDFRIFFADCMQYLSKAYEFNSRESNGHEFNGNELSGHEFSGLIASSWAAEIFKEVCPMPVVRSWEMASLYLDKPINYKYKSKLVIPNIKDLAMISIWIKEFYREALSSDIKNEEKIARVLIGKKQLYCLEAEGIGLTAMAMSIPVAEMGRLNLIYTPPSLRGRGYAREITASIATLVQNSGKLPVLYARLENKAAIELYKSLGFLEAGRLVELKF